MGEEVDQVRRNFRVSDVAASFGLALDKNGDEWEACCPFHAEDTPSFTVFMGKDRAERFHCFGCGERGDVLDFVQKIKGCNLPEATRILAGGSSDMPNIAPRENAQARDVYAGIKPILTDETIEVGKKVRLYNPKRAGHEWEWGTFTPSMVHRYMPGMYVLRREMRDGGKETPMVCRVRLPSGDECWSRFPFPKPRPLYGLGTMRPGQVIVVEGEKCVDKMIAATGRNVVSWSGGTQGMKYANWAPLAGRDVILWPDADGPGLTTMQAIGIELRPHVSRLRILDVADAAKGWDVADAIDDGWGRDRIDGFMRERIRPFELRAAEPTPEVPPAPADPAPEPAARAAVRAAASVPAKRERPPEAPPVGADGIKSLTGPFPDVAFGSEVYLANEYMMHAQRAVGGRIVSANGKFWAYGPTCWREISEHSMKIAAHGFDAVGVGMKGTPLKLGKKMVDNIVSVVADKTAEPSFFDEPTVGLNVRNGTVVLDNDGGMTLRDHDPDDRYRFTIDAEFSNNAALPPEGSLLATFFDGVFKDDPDKDAKIALIGEMFGAAAFGMATRVKSPKAFILKGDKANNGKSQVADMFTHFLPQEAWSAVHPRSFADEKHRAQLVGKVANIADELSADALAGDDFKAIVTGDPRSARDLYKSAFWFRPRALNCFTTNVLPRFNGGIDRGLRRRLVVVSFNRVIPADEIITNIAEKVAETELGLLLSFAVAGAARLKKNGEYTIPPSSEEALREWLLFDAFYEWIDVRTAVTSTPLGSWSRTSELFSSFKEWAINSGYDMKFLPHISSFAQRLRSLDGVDLKRVSDGTQVVGLVLRDGLYGAADDDDGPF